ncbi:MAG: hypothetical protein WC359_13555 [Dehalococcoidia bacterium]|jgi:hypothetical protein
MANLMQPYDPINLDQVKFAYNGSRDTLKEMLPYFYNDLENIIPNVNVSARVVAGIVKCVLLGEQKFTQKFGGWQPLSNEFGIAPLRPCHVHLPDNRWRWTSGASTSLFWSASDNFVGPFTVSNHAIIMIYGYFNLEPIPNTLELYFQPGSDKLPIWSVVPMRLSKQRYICLPKPIIIEPNSAINIKASCAVVSTVEEMGLLGFYFAGKSRLITEQITD